MKNENKKRSPLHDSPLNQAGQSLYVRLLIAVYNKRIVPIVVIILLFSLTIFEWLRLFFYIPNLHWVYTTVTVAFVLYYLLYRKKSLKEIENIRLGLEGEEIVAEKLNDLRELGYKVYNDIVADGFNIDHVVIGPAGVFTVETKTYRKNNNKDCQIYYDGQTVKIDNFDISKMKDPIKQAKGQKYWLEKKLRKYFNDIKIEAVVIFPGWYVNSNNSYAEVSVYNENSFLTVIKKEKQVLSSNEINEISRYLESYMRKD